MARHAKHFIKQPNVPLGKEIMSLSRLNLARFIRFISGHNRLNEHRSRVDKNLVSTCRFCAGPPETVIHFITNCPELVAERQTALIHDFQATGHWTVSELLEFSRLPRLNDFFSLFNVSSSSPTDTDSSDNSSLDDYSSSASMDTTL